MKGDFEVELKSDYCNYKFTIKRKITILTGDSAAGKSYLISLINHLQNSEDEGIRCKYTINTAIDWKTVQWIFNTLESKEQQISFVQATAKNKKTLIIFDAAAFGSEIKKLLDVLNDKHYDCDLFTPESFEWLICAAGIIDSDKINEAISDPYNNIDGTYFSWERFYTDLLQRETEVLENVYTKSKLNVCYYKPCCCKGKKQFHCNIKQGVNKINSILGRFMIDKQQDMNLF